MSRIMNCQLVVSFNFEDNDSDSISDAQHHALSFVLNHIMDDEENNPIKIHQCTILHLGETQ
jgi:hypothetical protein